MKKKDIEKTLSDAVFAVMPTDMFENIEKRLDPEKERIVTMKEVKNSLRLSQRRAPFLSSEFSEDFYIQTIMRLTQL